MSTVPFVQYCSWKDITEDAVRATFREFADKGITRIVLHSDFCRLLLDSPAHETWLHRLLREYGLSCRCAHGCWQDGEEMTVPFEYPEKRRRMLDRVKRTLEIAARCGADTCALHAESWSNKVPPRPLEKWMEYIGDAVEKLLPTAEANGICMALENIWGPPAMPQPLCDLADRVNSPWLGLCFDVGHANVISASGLKSCPWFTWIWKDYGPVPWTDDALQTMLPHIVTAHLHDNYSDTDSHDLPGKGNIDWKSVIPVLLSAPRLRSLQSEVSTEHGYSLEQLNQAFADILPTESMR